MQNDLSALQPVAQSLPPGTYAAFDEANVYGFDNRESASNLLAEDEYVRFDSMTEERELEIGAKKADISQRAQIWVSSCIVPSRP